MADPALPPGERVLWRGRPYPGLILRPIEVVLVPFSLFWAGFAVFWNYQVWTSVGSDASFRLFGVPFLVAGVYITVGRFVVDIALRRRIAYFVTDRRIMIVWPMRTVSLDIDRLPALEVEERRDGSGTIRFGAATGLLSGNGFHIWQPSVDPTPQFLQIPDVRSVHALIRQHADGRGAIRRKDCPVMPDLFRHPPFHERDNADLAGQWMPDQVRHDGEKN